MEQPAKIERDERGADSGAAHGSAKILHEGYIIEVAEGGPWLAQDGTVTINWGERGIWHDLTDAELALARSLSPNDRLQRPPTND